MKNLFAVTLALVVLSVPTFTQTDFWITDVQKNAEGVVIVNATPKRLVGFVVKGSNVSFEKSPTGNVFVNDEGVNLIFTFIKRSEFAGAGSGKSDEEILEKYRNWDVAGTEEDLGKKIEVDSVLNEKLLISEIRKTGNLSTVNSTYWSFVVPGTENSKRSSFQAVIVDDLILLVASTYSNRAKSDSVYQYFKDILSTLAIMDPPEKVKRKPSTKKKPAKSKTRK